jgi:hypothetical protein
MAVYTKIFLKFPKKFWPEGKGREFFLYASSRRGYYGVWQVHKESMFGMAPSAPPQKLLSEPETELEPCQIGT